MPMVQEIDYGHPPGHRRRDGDADDRRPRRDGARGHLDHARRDGSRHQGAEASAPPTSLNSFGSCRLCLVEIEGRSGTPASCTTPVAPGMKVHTVSDKLRKLRRGVMELYISDHPLDCLTCSANGNCELQTAAGEVGLRDVRYGYEGANHLSAAGRRLQPIFPVRSVEVHRLLALRARLRGSAGHLRADHPGPRLRLQGRGRHGRAVPDQRMRLLRRLRAGLPDRDADGKVRGRAGPAGAFGGHHLRLLRRRLQLQGGDARRPGRAHGAVEGRQGEPRPFLRQGPLRLGLCPASATASSADDPREDHRSLARSELGRGDRARRLGVQAHPGEGRQGFDRRHHLVALHRRGNLSGAEAGAHGVRQQQHRYLRAGLPLADRLWAEQDLRHLGRHAGFRQRRAVPTSSW